jgi:REP element-mobilizing transposase RayT
MNIEANCIYHIYNRGNRQCPIFLQEKNYFFFLQKIKRHIVPVADIIDYCLMPNHFHFLIYMDERSTAVVAKSNRDIAISSFSKQWRIVLSSYTRALQKQEGFKGSLFQQKTKAKVIEGWPQSLKYLTTCKEYIINNPVKAGLVSAPEDWLFSSYLDEVGLVPTRPYSSYDLES